MTGLLDKLRFVLLTALCATVATAAPRAQELSNARASSADAPNQFLLGGGRLGIQTEKSVRASDPLRRNECTTDDECEDYSGLPRSEPGKRNLKTFRKPFIGLSITRPLQ